VISQAFYQQLSIDLTYIQDIIAFFLSSYEQMKEKFILDILLVFSGAIVCVGEDSVHFPQEFYDLIFMVCNYETFHSSEIYHLAIETLTNILCFIPSLRNQYISFCLKQLLKIIQSIDLTSCNIFNKCIIKLLKYCMEVFNENNINFIFNITVLSIEKGFENFKLFDDSSSLASRAISSINFGFSVFTHLLKSLFSLLDFNLTRIIYNYVEQFICINEPRFLLQVLKTATQYLIRIDNDSDFIYKKILEFIECDESLFVDNSLKSYQKLFEECRPFSFGFLDQFQNVCFQALLRKLPCSSEVFNFNLQLHQPVLYLLSSIMKNHSELFNTNQYLQTLDEIFQSVSKLERCYLYRSLADFIKYVGIISDSFILEGYQLLISIDFYFPPYPIYFFSMLIQKRCI
jgi:hypothetical protein